ncbi:hypothetical protein [Phycisphaera mikurensis]|uniref:Uncharacterized protein n=1 Tax=Phycisphaera mikurensis (strain NBRC 102666 / KCTC 22515 / FYK2301M01) TaxID=1142394 RepID=I0IIN5_PHYMF|nr:hypothetical protein [Phycisphaera mikurensis]MBB6442725.1 hypothetical protein [Phycisphaera mikurensis]BAM05123.1 hypothetical protein PSMK_29640 [Phycisphaera mikurensis NBRC 102666]
MTAAPAADPAVSAPRDSVDTPARPHAAVGGEAVEEQGSGLAPWKWVLVSAGLWVLACAAALGALLAVEAAADAADATQDESVVLTYLFFAPSTLLTLAAFAAFVIGSVRWAIAGAHGEGLKTAAAASDRALLKQISERMLVSETAKRVAYRVEDIRLLRETIEADLARKDFDAAMVLLELMSETYGRLEEAEKFRERIEAARDKEIQVRVGHEVSRLDAMLERDELDRAAMQAARIKRLFPTVQSVAHIDTMVAAAKGRHKHELEREFRAAAAREDTPRAMKLLEQIDREFSHEEGLRIQDVAREVIGKQRENLRVQFEMAVHDQEWGHALTVGEEIIRDFPNTKMADEVRDRLELLRERSAGQAAR